MNAKSQATSKPLHIAIIEEANIVNTSEPKNMAGANPPYFD